MTQEKDNLSVHLAVSDMSESFLKPAPLPRSLSRGLRCRFYLVPDLLMNSPQRNVSLCQLQQAESKIYIALRDS